MGGEACDASYSHMLVTVILVKENKLFVMLESM